MKSGQRIRVLISSPTLCEETDSWRTQNLVCTRTQEKGALAPQETDPDLPVSVQESLAEAWVGGGPATGLGAPSAAVPDGTF